jgi:hypothetical protein
MQSLYHRLTPAQQTAMVARWGALSTGWGHYQGLVALGFTRTLLAIAVGFAGLGGACFVLAIRGVVAHDLAGRWTAAAAGLPWLAAGFVALLGLLLLGAWLISRRMIWRLAVPMFQAFDSDIPFAQLPLSALPDAGEAPILQAAIGWSSTWGRPPKGFPVDAMLDALFDLASSFAPEGRAAAHGSAGSS